MSNASSLYALQPDDLLIGVGCDTGAALKLAARAIFNTHNTHAPDLRAHGAKTTRVVHIAGDTVTEDQRIVPQKTYGIIACVSDQPAFNRLEKFLSSLPPSNPLKKVPVFARFTP